MISIIISILIFGLLVLNVDIEPLSKWCTYPLLFILVLWCINMLLFNLQPDNITNRKIIISNKDVVFSRDSIIIKIENKFTGALTFYKIHRFDCTLIKSTSGKIDEIQLIIPCYNKRISNNIGILLFNPFHTDKIDRFNWIKRKNKFHYSENLGKIRIVTSNKNNYVISKFTLTDF